MEKLAEILPPDVMPEIEKYLEYGVPSTERTSLWSYNLIPGFSAEAAQDGYENWNVRKTDVLLASYPKTGKNFFFLRWLRFEQLL